MVIITRIEQIPTRTNTASIFVFIRKKQGIFTSKHSFTTIFTRVSNYDTARCQFHQCFLCSFLYESPFLAAFSSYFLALSKNWYKKCMRISLMKLTVGVNFINILSERSFCKKVLFSFTFWQKGLSYEKLARKMLMKLTIGWHMFWAMKCT